MSDREYLELAAKAAGIELRFPCDPLTYEPVQYVPPRRTDTWENWNPLTDDGDAFRLMVKLRMVVDTDYNGGANAGNAAVDFGEPEYGYQEGQGKTDHFAATRRAIVRAAAEIGKGMA